MTSIDKLNIIKINGINIDLENDPGTFDEAISKICDSINKKSDIDDKVLCVHNKMVAGVRDAHLYYVYKDMTKYKYVVDASDNQIIIIRDIYSKINDTDIERVVTVVIDIDFMNSRDISITIPGKTITKDDIDILSISYYETYESAQYNVYSVYNTMYNEYSIEISIKDDTNKNVRLLQIDIRHKI